MDPPLSVPFGTSFSPLRCSERHVHSYPTIIFGYEQHNVAIRLIRWGPTWYIIYGRKAKEAKPPYAHTIICSCLLYFLLFVWNGDRFMCARRSTRHTTVCILKSQRLPAALPSFSQGKGGQRVTRTDND